MRSNSWMKWIGAVTVLALTAAANATLLAPGSSVGDGVPSSPGSLSVFSDTPALVTQVSTPVATPTYSGTLTSAVFTNAGGTLDFYYQFTNNASSSDGIERLSMTSFTGFTTDVGYRTSALAPFTAGAQAPLFADRSASGSVVGFYFDSNNQAGPYLVDPGESSRTIVIRTNATQFFAGNTAVIDGFAANAPSFAPSAIPEPASLAGLATIALGALARRRRN
ncbi:MAG: PEP-CTERM sorting domain-containing protein [Anaerolineae bacterium]|nr:PEP-CTERM sorting domain-containing protein [Phycisphaerae bacterium]